MTTDFNIILVHVCVQQQQFRKKNVNFRFCKILQMDIVIHVLSIGC